MSTQSPDPLNRQVTTGTADQGSPVTDRSVGAVSGYWSGDRFADYRARTFRPEHAARRKARRDKQDEATAADFCIGETVAVRLGLSAGREIRFKALVVEVMASRVQGERFDHVLVVLEEALEPTPRDEEMVAAVLGHLFKLEFLRGHGFGWGWHRDTVKWVPEG